MKLFQSGFNNKGRTENVILNTNIAFICEAITLVLGFVSRSVFVSMLGKTYLGVNGVFSNILTILNFAELGFGTAIVYNLYKPLREHDENKVSALINFYKKAYYIIGGIIFVAGLILTPFISYLIKKQPDVSENISVLYLLYLFSTVSTYFFAHKKSLLHADQKNYVVNLYHQLFRVIQTVAQIVFLIVTRNYILYLIIQIVCSLLENFFIAKRVDRLYPFLKVNKDKKIETSLFRSIKNDVGALIIYKLNSAILHGTDNVLITAIEEDGVQSVGLYANYTLISETLNTVLGIVTNALTPSIGNLNSEEDSRKKENVFYTILFFSAWAYGFCCMGIMFLSEQFITVWLGEEYVLDLLVVFSIALQLYIRSVHYAAYTYRITCGLFVQSKYVPFFTSLINIGLSIWFGKLWGLFGILFATSVARVFTIGISDPYLVYKYVFHKKPTQYYLRYAGYLLLVIACGFAGKFVISFIPISGWLGFFVNGIVFSIVFNALYVLLVFKTKEFKYLRNSGEDYLKRFIGKFKHEN